jgi:hypothetical protein
MLFLAGGSLSRNRQPLRVSWGCTRWVRRGAWHDEAALQTDKHNNEIVKPNWSERLFTSCTLEINDVSIGGVIPRRKSQMNFDVVLDTESQRRIC